MVVTCEIQFEQNAFGTYFAGQVVSGTVTLTSDKPKDVKGVLLKISGYAVTNWRERHRNKRQQFHGREDYMSSLTYLKGSEDNNKCTIETGIHMYSFTCELPHNCPTSFEGQHGCIRYVAKVLLIRPWKFDQTYSRGFTVLKTIDLNYDTPQLRLPSDTQAYKIFCCGPCKTEPLKLELHVPQTGYVPGQVIPATVLVINNTNIPVSAVTFSLNMLVRYYSRFPSEQSIVERIVMATVKSDSVLRNCTRSLTEELSVPATPPTCLNACGIIQIAYQVEVEAKMKGMHANQVITMPVTIGNVPLWSAAAAGGGVVQQQPSSSSSSRAMQQLAASAAEFARETKDAKLAESLENEKVSPSAGTADNRELPIVAAINNANATAPPHTPVEAYTNMPPPSYEESVHTERGDINEDELHAFGPCEFAPLYPVYNLRTAPAAAPTAANGRQNGGYVNHNFES